MWVRDTPYFLLQRQFESPDGGRVYVECHQRELCGHVWVSGAVLNAGLLRLELATRPPHVIAIRFKADDRRFQQLTAMLKTIIGVVASSSCRARVTAEIETLRDKDRQIAVSRDVTLCAASGG